ncbi:hypothetical protein AB1Y20_002925 [Prymnesium parvum]|uniref:Uncharacterized protein n=1 Tax=Prymnesium parvum TaxID=97485 RepID=A0AB34JBZ5_PRYPA
MLRRRATYQTWPFASTIPNGRRNLGRRMAPSTLLWLLLLGIGGRGEAHELPAFATFGNAQTRAFVKAWQPKPLPVSSGDALLPTSKERMKRYVRARILLEDPNIGCIASCDDAGFNVILCRFTKAEHSLLLPLWQPTVSDGRPKTFKTLAQWHQDKFDDARLSGGALEWTEDRKAWADAFDV